ncbi:MAG: hypothetical protein KAJ19_07395 [Gammaproteobacteria bacterium]|nr:hypothetical protein [Gammaproteobacteria bacterium]
MAQTSDSDSQADTLRIPPEGPVDLSSYSTEDAVLMVGLLRKYHRLDEVVQVGYDALRRNLTPTQDAAVRHDMAYAYEFVPGGGPLAREKYGEVLEMHPTYQRNGEVALRLGQLNDSTILPGTEQNYARAIECYEYVVKNCSDTEGEKAYVDVLQARMHVGDIYSLQREYRKSDRHYKAIYDCDPNSLTAPAYKVFDRANDAVDYIAWAKNRLEILKGAVRHHLVSNCIRSGPDQTIAKLESLREKYADDPEIVKSATDALRETWEWVARVNRTIDDNIGGPDQQLEGPVGL